MDVALNAAREICHSNRVMASQETIIDVFLDNFETSTGHVCLADSLNFLKPMLLTEWVKAPIDSVK